MEGQNYEQALPVGFKITGGKHDYIIEKVLGLGGFGITYKVKSRIKIGNLGFDVHCAVKEYFPSGCWRDPGSTLMLYSPTSAAEVKSCLKDFIAEGHRLQRICQMSPNIVDVNEVFEANGTAYFVMEYLDGGDIRHLVKASDGGLTEADMLGILTPVAGAVQCLHDNMLLHLDIKPENIVMRRDSEGGPDVPVLIDFGISVHFTSSGTPTTTRPSKGVTHGYSPAEQFAGITRFSPQLDIYALSATCYYMLTGKDPQSAFDITADEIRSKLSGKASERTINAIVHGMSRNAANRPATVRQFLNYFDQETLMLKPPLRDPSKEIERRTKAQTQMPAKKQKWPLIVSIACGALLLAGILFWVINSHSSSSSPLSSSNDSIVSTSTDEKSIPANLSERRGEILRDTTYSEELHKLAESGDADAQLLLAICYDNGKGTAVDFDKATQWYKKSADNDNAIAQYVLAFSYIFPSLSKLNVTEDKKKGFELLQESADNGFDEAQFLLASAYETGDDVNKDENKAMILYRQAAENGHVTAQCRLGECYLFGKGVTTDNKKAVEWFSKAAEAGEDNAQYRLGTCYENGWGLHKSKDQAVEWYRKAARKHNEDAQDRLKDMGYSWE